MKPTHGRVPQWPNPGDSLLLGDSGPIASTVTDLAVLLSVVAGPDPRDPIARDEPPDFLEAATVKADRPFEDLRLACTPDFGYFAVDPAVAAIVNAAAQRIEELGGLVEEAQPDVEDPFALYLPLYLADFRQLLRRFGDAASGELFAETTAEMEANQPIDAAEYVAVLNRLWEFRASVARFFDEYDLLISPATAVPSFPLRSPPGQIGNRPVSPG